MSFKGGKKSIEDFPMKDHVQARIGDPEIT